MIFFIKCCAFVLKVTQSNKWDINMCQYVTWYGKGKNIIKLVQFKKLACVSKSGKTELVRDPGVPSWPGDESMRWKSPRRSSRFCHNSKVTTLYTNKYSCPKDLLTLLSQLKLVIISKLKCTSDF
jgi:hypothetical protein